MQIKRLWQTFRMYTLPNNMSRANYCRENKIFANLGKGCALPRMLIPLYPELINFGDNIRVGSGVLFITHDDIHNLLNTKHKTQNTKHKTQNTKHKTQINEFIGCIEISNNVFIGANSIIYPNVTIGSNVVIAAGSVIIKSIPSNTIVGGNPAKKVGSFDLLERRRLYGGNVYPDNLKTKNKYVSKGLKDFLWERHAERSK